MRNEITTLISQIKDEVTRVRAVAVAVASTPDAPVPVNTVTNFELLLKTIKTFYGRDKKAPYLPHALTSGVMQRLNEVGVALAAVKTGADDPEAAKASELMPPLLKQMDELYAYCLQYGIISFGFGAKVVQEQINLVQAAVTDVESEKAAILAKISEDYGVFSQTLNSTSGAVTNRLAAFEKSVATTTDAIAPQLAEVNKQVDATRLTAAQAEDLLKAVQTTATETSNTKEKLAGLLATATEEAENTRDATNTALEGAKSAESQAEKSAATAKQANKEAGEAKVEVDSRRTAITEFFTQINEYREAILKTQVQASESALALKLSTEKDVAEFRERTAKIASDNESLLKEIRAHLGKAVGVGLFSVFETRRKGARNASWFWAALLILSTGGAVWMAFLLAEAFGKSDTSGKVLLARFLVAIPIAFLITFFARQYARNRQAEDEYAFKASISVSLDPFRGLIEKMRKDDNAEEIPFVIEYVKEIYDNPTKRLYPGAIQTPASNVEQDVVAERTTKKVPVVSQESGQT